jgi:CotS family spore coat protein
VSLQTELEHQYGIEIRQWRDMKDVVCVETQKHGHLCLKPFHFPAEEVQFIADVLQHLERKGFPYSPRMQTTRQGQYWMSYGHRRYILTNWIHGQAPAFEHPTQLRKSVRTLARFHKHAQNMDATCIPIGRNRVPNLEKRFRDAEGRIGLNHDKVKDTKPFQEICREAIRHLKTANAKRAIAAEAACTAFVHGDFNYPNIVVDEHKHHQLIDFENTSHYVRMEDLAHIIHRNHPWQADGGLRLIEVYDQVRPIHGDDLRLLVALLCEPYPLIRMLRQKRPIRSGTLPAAAVIVKYATSLRKLVE